MTEEWRDIPGWEGLYQASNEGRIKTLARVEIFRTRWGTDVPRRRKERVLSPCFDRYGYLKVCLSRGGNHHFTVHRLVCLAFHGLPPDGKNQASHRNGICADNRSSNLRWASHVENELDKIAHGTAGTYARNLAKAHGLIP